MKQCSSNSSNNRVSELANKKGKKAKTSFSLRYLFICMSPEDAAHIYVGLHTTNNIINKTPYRCASCYILTDFRSSEIVNQDQLSLPPSLLPPSSISLPLPPHPNTQWIFKHLKHHFGNYKDSKKKTIPTALEYKTAFGVCRRQRHRIILSYTCRDFASIIPRWTAEVNQWLSSYMDLTL